MCLAFYPQKVAPFQAPPSSKIIVGRLNRLRKKHEGCIAAPLCAFVGEREAVCDAIRQTLPAQNAYYKAREPVGKSVAH
jgi:hypothetical protein